uniref:Uncharacterized protein n=1 Tax=Cucumis sativus TaxID=3659 RepID=A0A0A0LXT1_CUCSA
MNLHNTTKLVLFFISSGFWLLSNRLILFVWHYSVSQTEAELLAEKRCVAHLTGEGIAVCDLPGDTMLPGEM